MILQDALFNWLQMAIVAEARPDDKAAKETRDFFEQILKEDHGLTEFYMDEQEGNRLSILYQQEGNSKKQMFDRESAEKLLEDIRSNPKYNEQ
jgi:tellurite resistance protein